VTTLPGKFKNISGVLPLKAALSCDSVRLANVFCILHTTATTVTAYTPVTTTTQTYYYAATDTHIPGPPPAAECKTQTTTVTNTIPRTITTTVTQDLT
jgi:hypothetical protein